MPPIPGLVHWHHYLARNVKTIKAALSKAARALDASVGRQPQAQLEPILVRNNPKQPLHPLARIRQTQSRWFSSAARSLDGGARHFTSSASGRGARYDRASFPKSRVSTHISQSSGRAPFAHTLRPNLTGGTLGRTSGGYSLGGGRAGGQRYFSHTPASQAQVIQNVSQAVRAFFVGGQKAQFDGQSPYGKRYRAVSALQEETGRKMRHLPRSTPGSHVEFRINPTVTALTPLGAIAGFADSESALPADHLNTEGLLNVLSADFSRALKDLAAVMNDLRRLSALGDLPITYEGSYLRVHFSGCDAETVERLCEELNVTRGSVTQDASFDAFAGTEIALLFPFAPSEAESELSVEDYYEQRQQDFVLFPDSPPLKKQRISVGSMFSPEASPEWEPAYSTQSARSSESGMSEMEMVAENPWLSSPSAYSTQPGSSGYESSEKNSPLEYQGFEGIYRFIEEFDAVRR